MTPSSHIRIIFRLAEFSNGTGTNNPIPYHEGYMYGLDAVPMALALYVMSLSHPAQTLVGLDSEFPKLTRAEKKAGKTDQEEREARNEGCQEARSWGGCPNVYTNRVEAGREVRSGNEPMGWCSIRWYAIC